MSDKIPVWGWTGAVVQSNIAPLTKLVLLCLSRYFSEAGKGWRVPVATIIKETGLSNRSVATHLQLASEAKLLTIKREIGPKGHREVTTYIPRFPPGFVLQQQAEIESLSEAASRGQSGVLSEPPSREPASRQVSFQKARAKSRAGKGRRKKGPRAKIKLTARLYDDHKLQGEKAADSFRKVHKIAVDADSHAQWREMFRREYVEPHEIPADASEMEETLSLLARAEEARARIRDEMNAALLKGNKKRAAEWAKRFEIIGSQIAQLEEAMRSHREKVPA